MFVQGVSDQNGYDIPKGAVWDIQYVEGKGFTLKNVGTGKYLHDASPARYDDPAYFTFCTLGTKTGITPLPSDICPHPSVIYNLQGVNMGTDLKPGIYIKEGKKVIISE